ncbi:MAG: hypothetical protein HEP71_17195 [Roseivirga sp.]|nr:hypothetical protein [Roseivirga sp.]
MKSAFKNIFSGLKRPASDQELDFHTDLQLIDKAHHRITYRGISMLKCPFDIVIYQMIISEVQPDLIIEIGTNKGGSALYLADLLRNFGDGVVHTIDLKQEKLDPEIRSTENIRLFEGGWQNYSLEDCAEFDKILIIDDGSHTYEQVYQAFHKFHPVVPPGSYYIIEDGIIDQLEIPKKKFNGGPLKAINEILATNTSFKVETKWTHFFGPNATFNTRGYLKRI